MQVFVFPVLKQSPWDSTFANVPTWDFSGWGRSRIPFRLLGSRLLSPAAKAECAQNTAAEALCSAGSAGLPRSSLAVDLFRAFGS